MIKGKYEFAYKLLLRLEDYIRKQYQWKDGQIFYHICEARKEFEKLYSMTEEERENIKRKF